MSDKNEKYRAQLREATAPHCDGDVETVGIFQPKGVLGARPLAEWDRGAVTASREHGTATDQLILELPGDEGTIRFESMKQMSGGFNEPVFEALNAVG